MDYYGKLLGKLLWEVTGEVTMGSYWGRLLGEGHLWVPPTQSSYFSRLTSTGDQGRNSSYLSRGLKKFFRISW